MGDPGVHCYTSSHLKPHALGATALISMRAESGWKEVGVPECQGEHTEGCIVRELQRHRCALEEARWESDDRIQTIK